ncbi:hypothetical protein [Aurantiacibacter sp. D1-12]|uniref:hypothetical protein n=1 Tax=Aurantiacibacter sp. D1-12 TaxID=2993658 RepID=UPI00237C8882|nr:hypothetical protein [Aurantiacibacter sp. D1-12]MDE1466865.1 hypothetical protein [Aurantiacibacter sp. D1-12]
MATAIFHLTGLSMVGGWMEGVQGRTITALWIAPAIGWMAVSAFWTYHAFSGETPSWSATLVTAAIPLAVAIPLATYVAPTHPGGYMLIAASTLALVAKKRFS